MPTLLNNCLCSRLEAPGYVDDALLTSEGGSIRLQDKEYMVATRFFEQGVIMSVIYAASIFFLP